MSEQNKTGQPVQLRESMYSNPGSGVTSLPKGKSVQSSPDKNIKTDSKSKSKHPIAGNPATEPSTTAPKVHPQARHSNSNARPDASGGPNEPRYSPSRETTSPAPSRGEGSKSKIPSSGRVEAQLGHAYSRTPVRDAVEDRGAHRRAITPQIKQHPVHVPKNQKNEKS
jgi:hypothetical protein